MVLPEKHQGKGHLVLNCMPFWVAASTWTLHACVSELPVFLVYSFVTTELVQCNVEACKHCTCMSQITLHA